MYIRTKAIVLSVIKYNDNSAIIKTYTEKTGFTSYFIRNFYKSRKIKKALFQPNNLLELWATAKNKGQLEYIKEAQSFYHYKNLHADYDKLNISTFMREILLESLKNEQADEELFAFISREFIELDQTNFQADFHLVFMLLLSKYLGFFPDIQSQGKYFDLQNGFFTDNLPPFQHLNAADTKLFRDFLGTIFATKKNIKNKHSGRIKLLNIMLEFYRLHIDQFNEPKSVKVLHGLYN